MHAGKEKRRSNPAIDHTATSIGTDGAIAPVEGTVRTNVKPFATACTLSSCNTIRYDKDDCICWRKLVNDPSTTDCTNFWRNKQKQLNWDNKYHHHHHHNHWYHSHQQIAINKKLYSGRSENSKVSSARIEFNHCLQSGKYLFVKRNERSLLTTRSHENILLKTTGLCVRATVSESFRNLNGMKYTDDDMTNILLLEQLSNHHRTSISTTSTTASAISADIAADDSTSVRLNPFLRHSRSTSMRLGLTLDSVCYVWSSVAPNDLCKLSPWPRYQFLRKISIFNRDCLEENNIKAAQLFRLSPRYVNSEADLRMQAKFLRANVEGQACILAPAGAQQCLSCFQKIDRGLKRVDKAYEKFNLTLHRFDCMLAVDTASTTRPFSPNGSCTDCKIWYRKWLVIHSLNLWSVPPCINWCYYVQLACPHLATSKVVDYAGHPSFQCRDLHIPLVNIPGDPGLIKWTNSVSKKKSMVASKCACLHPCDLEEFYNVVDIPRTAEQNRPSSYPNTILINSEEEDFFPSAQHCMLRRHHCGSMKNEVEGHRIRRRSLTIDDDNSRRKGEKLQIFKLNDVSLSNYLISIISIFMRSSDSSEAVPHRQDSAIQESFIDPVGYPSQWWTKHRARRRSQFNTKNSTTIITNNSNATINTATTAPVTINSITVIPSTATVTTTVNAGVNLKGMRWNICSGIFIYTLYTLFFSFLLLRRPPFAIGFLI
uniref:TGF_BETA_2 domain-containing protein n=1 Tax=Elaeophora elaphi TaxID=1147741 RepID=A0A0R3RS62_9BILA